MDYRTTYRSFINSYYLAEGIRITAGITLPTVIGTYLNQENMGITFSIGAVCVTIVDNAGPILHRKNAMLVCNAVIFIASLLTGFAVGNAWLTAFLIAGFCFMFSMIGVYGARAGSIGLAGLFVIVLNMQRHMAADTVLINSLYILGGGLWYMLLSLSLYSFRPYKVTQQALGDLIQSVGEYILYRAEFYRTNPDYEKIYATLLDKQAEVNEKQNLVRELLYKSRDIVKESTNTGRITLLIFIDINDLFERIMSLQLHHKLFHQYFDHSQILEEFKRFLTQISDELNETGISLKSGRTYPMNDNLENGFARLKKEFEEFRNKELTTDNAEAIIGLRALLDATEDFVSRILAIQKYTAYDQKDVKQDARVQNYDQFVSHQDIDAKIFLSNFNWKSNTFRHALRVALATTVGFLISEFLPFGHGYWILLTIIVILKPAYSITKSRNRDRLLGTIVGALIGVVIIFVVKDRHLMIAIMIVLMILAYSFMRIRYLLFVTLMTPYVLILLFILNPIHFKDLILDRVFDTAIGSGIALLANLLFSPEWAYKHFAEYLQKMLLANKNYLSDVASMMTAKPVPVNQYKLSRKQAYVSLANMTDALNQMIAEPKSKQKNAAEYHELVVLNYMLSTHIATLASFAISKNPPAPEPEYSQIVHAIQSNLDQAMNGLQVENGPSGAVLQSLANPHIDDAREEKDGLAAKEAIRNLNERMNVMLEERKKEIAQGIPPHQFRVSLASVKSVNDQFNFMWKISEDLLKALKSN